MFRWEKLKIRPTTLTYTFLTFSQNSLRYQCGAIVWLYESTFIQIRSKYIFVKCHRDLEPIPACIGPRNHQKDYSGRWSSEVTITERICSSCSDAWGLVWCCRWVIIIIMLYCYNIHCFLFCSLYYYYYFSSYLFLLMMSPVVMLTVRV